MAHDVVECARCGFPFPRHWMQRLSDGPVCKRCLSRARFAGATAVDSTDGTIAQPTAPASAPSEGSENASGNSGKRDPKETADVVRLYRALRNRLDEQVRGHSEAVKRLSLAAALHLSGAGGQCVFLIGESGVGKSHLLRSLVEAMTSICDWDGGLPHGHMEASDLIGPGWAGGKSVGAFVADALERASSRDNDAHPVLVIDEIHWIRSTDGDASGNTRRKQEEVFAALLALTGGGHVVLDGAGTWNAKGAFVILAGACPGLEWSGSTPSAADLTRYGFPWELANRIAGNILLLSPPSERTLRDVLQRWPSLISSIELARRVGPRIEIAPEAFAMMAAAVKRDPERLPLRVAGERLKRAVDHVLLRLLDEGLEDAPAIVIGPDDVECWG